jgi:hypothetical protein
MPFATHRSQQIHYTVEGAGPLAGGAVIQGGLAASTPRRHRSFNDIDPKRILAFLHFSTAAKPRTRPPPASNGFCQSGNRRNDHLARVSAKAEDQRGSRRRRNVQTAHRANDDAVVARGAFDRDIRKTCPQVCDEMHSLIWRIDRHLVAQPEAESSDQNVALIPIH